MFKISILPLNSLILPVNYLKMGSLLAPSRVFEKKIFRERTIFDKVKVRGQLLPAPPCHDATVIGRLVRSGVTMG